MLYPELDTPVVLADIPKIKENQRPQLRMTRSKYSHMRCNYFFSGLV